MRVLLYCCGLKLSLSILHSFLLQDIHSHKKEIREREETITDKEKRIFDLKKKNQELEKFSLGHALINFLLSTFRRTFIGDEI